MISWIPWVSHIFSFFCRDLTAHLPEAYQDPLRFEEARHVIVGRACRCIRVQQYFPIYIDILYDIKCNMTLAWKGNDVDDDDDDDDDGDLHDHILWLGRFPALQILPSCPFQKGFAIHHPLIRGFK